jgi:hypothetical protein
MTDLATEIELLGQVTFFETVNEERLRAGGRGVLQYIAGPEACALCAALNGEIVAAGSEEAAAIDPPLHPNCQCFWAECGEDEPVTLTPERLAGLSDLVEQHGVFIDHREGDEDPRYVALQVPASPLGRDFTLRRGAHGEPGTIEWHRPRYPLSGLYPSTIQGGVEAVGPRWVPVGAGAPLGSPAAPPGGLSGAEAAAEAALAEHWARERARRAATATEADDGG